MSTHCNVIVKFGKTKVYLYRHHDGYLSSTGVDIAEKLLAVTSEQNFGGARGHLSVEGQANKFLHALLAEKYEATEYRPEKPVYEFTDQVHGDSEYLYKIVFDIKKRSAFKVQIGVCFGHDLEELRIDSWFSPAAFQLVAATEVK